MIKIPKDIADLGFILHCQGTNPERIEMYDSHLVCLTLLTKEKKVLIEFAHGIFMTWVTLNYPHPRLKSFVEQARTAKAKLGELQ